MFKDLENLNPDNDVEIVWKDVYIEAQNNIIEVMFTFRFKGVILFEVSTHFEYKEGQFNQFEVVEYNLFLEEDVHVVGW